MAWRGRRPLHTLRSTYWRWSLPGVGKELATAGGAEAARPSRTDGFWVTLCAMNRAPFPFYSNTRVDRSIGIDHRADRFAGSWLLLYVLVHIYYYII